MRVASRDSNQPCREIGGAPIIFKRSAGCRDLDTAIRRHILLYIEKPIAARIYFSCALLLRSRYLMQDIECGVTWNPPWSLTVYFTGVANCSDSRLRRVLLVGIDILRDLHMRFARIVWYFPRDWRRGGDCYAPTRANQTRAEYRSSMANRRLRSSHAP